jgi:hypothetical protein
VTPLELIDQMLGRPEFSCTEKQMRFLKDLIIQNQDPKAVEKAAEIHKKKVLAALRRNVTEAKKNLNFAEKELSDWVTLKL